MWGGGGGDVGWGGGDISRRTLGDRTNSPSSQRTEFRASFFVSPLLLFYLIISRSPSFPGALPIRPFSSIRPRNTAAHASLPSPTMPSSFYVPILIGGMLLTVCSSPSPPRIQPVLTPSRAPATRYGASGRCVPPSLSHTRTLISPRLRTCNVSRTATTLILPSGCSTSSPSGRPSRCSVRDSLRSAHCVHVAHSVTVRTSRRDALYVHFSPIFDNILNAAPHVSCFRLPSRHLLLATQSASVSTVSPPRRFRGRARQRRQD